MAQDRSAELEVSAQLHIVEEVPRPPELELEQTAKIPAPSNVNELGPEATEGKEDDRKLDRKPLRYLLVQHFSNSWGVRTAEFALYLFLITVFPSSLLPASLFGFFTTGATLLFSGWAGHQVDIRHNLHVVQVCILTIKISGCVAYAASLALLYRRDPTDPWADPLVRGLFVLITCAGCVHEVAAVAISVAVEREWVTVIADGSDNLTVINTFMRRIDLLCKLCAPLFVSLFTATTSYIVAAYVLLGIEAVSMVFELSWIAISYRSFPSLRAAQLAKDSSREQRSHTSQNPTLRTLTLRMLVDKLKVTTKAQLSDWKEFAQHPIFLSSISISCLYLTVLSFDGTMLSYLKAETYSDPFVAGMRGLNVVAGLAGTLAMPFLERRLGLVRAGNWSIWSEALCLIPVVVAFYVGAPVGSQAPAWNEALLFGGMMFSRVGLWAFDLCQLKELQMALADHPRRNSITALQFSLQSIANLMKYILTMVLSRPSQFKYAALASFISVVIGAFTYVAYVKRERGHIFHRDMGMMMSLITKKQ